VTRQFFGTSRNHPTVIRITIIRAIHSNLSIIIQKNRRVAFNSETRYNRLVESSASSELEDRIPAVKRKSRVNTESVDEIMDRASLERLTVEQLRQEAARYRLPTTGRKIDLIESIVSHLENNGPALDFLGPSQAQQDSEGGAGTSRPTDPSDQSDVLRQMVSAL